MKAHIIQSDARSIPLADKSVNCCVTSPPYFGLRDYGTARWEGGDAECDHQDDAALAERMRQKKSMIAVGERIDGSTRTRVHGEEIGKTVQHRKACPKCGAVRIDSQIGLEETPEAYVATMVKVFREVRRVLRDDGTLWLNIGDSYAANRSYQVASTKGGAKHSPAQGALGGSTVPKGLKSKDLIGIPWMLAFALRSDGWYLRQEIIWHKPSPMPESVTDRCTKAHEHIFLLTKSPKYYFDQEAILEPFSNGSDWIGRAPTAQLKENADRADGGGRATSGNEAGRKKRSVGPVSTKPFKEAHFATFPPALIEPCILAGSATGDLVLDPFSGSGTTGEVTIKHGRRYFGSELSMDYIRLSQERLSQVQPLMPLPRVGVAGS